MNSIKNSKVCSKIDKALSIFLTIFIIGFVLLIFALGARIFVADKFGIPTNSMEPTIIPGDYVVVNKLIAGARIYKNLNFFDGKKLETWRMPGWRKIKPNDIVVFNYPYPEDGKGISFSIAVVYLKRCIGTPGDTISIVDGYYRNYSTDSVLGDIQMQNELSRSDSSQLEPPIILALPRGEPDTKWSIKNLGPLYVPKKGDTIRLDSTNYKSYSSIVEYETDKKLQFKADSLRLGGNFIKEYTFGQNYYFVGGDNVLNSKDSRYWGFLPEEFIVGVASHILYSADRDDGRFRWDRLLKKLQ